MGYVPYVKNLKTMYIKENIEKINEQTIQDIQNVLNSNLDPLVMFSLIRGYVDAQREAYFKEVNSHVRQERTVLQ